MTDSDSHSRQKVAAAITAEPLLRLSTAQRRKGFAPKRAGHVWRGGLPRPVFDLASGTTRTMTSSNFKIPQDETSRPIFPRRANRFESADDGNYRDLTDTDSGRSSDSAQHANPSIRKEYK